MTETSAKMASWMLLVLALIGTAAAESCKNPRVTAASFTSQDATVVTAVAYIAEFTLACDEPPPETYALYADVDGESLTAARVGPHKYQVSWTEEISKARSGSRSVHILDEEGWGALRRARRADPAAPLVPLLTIQLHHPGSYTGPWVNSEVLATGLSVLVAYTALRQKSKIMA